MKIKKKIKLCFVSLYSYPLFNPICQSVFGGSEVRVSIIAKELAKKSRYQIDMIVFDHGQSSQEVRDGITLHAHTGYAAFPITPAEQSSKVYPEEQIISWQRQFINRLNPLSQRVPSLLLKYARWMYSQLSNIKSLIYSFFQSFINGFKIKGRIGSYPIDNSRLVIYDNVDADIYISHGSNNITAEVAFYCRKKGKTHIFLAGSDGDYQSVFKELPFERSYYNSINHVLVFAINHATRHIVQSERQAQLLQQNYNRESVIIRNPIDTCRAFHKNAIANTILWIGKADEVKQPWLILDLARHLSDYHFTVIMNHAHQSIFDQYVAEAEILPNVRMLTYIPYGEIERYFAEAKILCNTSTFEGFPNAFLQALKYEVPIVSLRVDPEKILSQHKCGLSCDGDFASMIENVRRLMTTPTMYAEMGANCLKYLHTFHEKSVIIAEYEKIFNSYPYAMPNKMNRLFRKLQKSFNYEMHRKVKNNESRTIV